MRAPTEAPESGLEEAVKKGQFALAAALAEAAGRPAKEIQDLRHKALWQMAAVYRNAPGTRRLAQRYGLSRKEVEEFLRKEAQERGRGKDGRPLRASYDSASGRYLSFQEWLERLLRQWERL